VKTVRCLTALVVATLSSAASASPSSADAARAQVLVRQATTLQQRGDSRGALDALTRAFALAPTPQTAMALATLQSSLGQLVEARDVLSAVVYETAPQGEAPAAAAARTEAAKLFASLDARIPRVQVTITGGTPPARLTLDATALPDGAERLPLPVDPGHHTLLAEAEGAIPRVVELDVTEGAERTLAIRLSPARPLGASAPALSPRARPPVQPASSEPPSPPLPTTREGSTPVWGPARVGFQIDTRVSVQAPAGSLANGTSLSSILGVRAYWAFDLGWKVNEWLFVGGFLGASMGGEGSAVSQACQAASESLQDETGDTSSSACLTLGVDLGAVAIASLNPTGSIDPWVGLGLGYEHQTFAYAGVKGQFDGVELPMLLTGVEWRTRAVNGTSLLGIGPYLGATVEKYSSGSVATFEGSTAAGPATHTWIHIGLRMTAFP
jgi:hypothetical protein